MTWSKRFRSWRPRYRSTAVDRVLAPARTVVTAGPFAGISPQRIDNNLRSAVSAAPRPHLAVVPDEHAHWWAYDADGVRNALVSRPDLDTDDLGRLVTEVRSSPAVRNPVEVLLCGEYLLLDYSHGVGDGQFGPTAIAVLASEDGAEAAGVLAAGLSPWAMWAALRRHFVARPSALRAAWTLRRHHGADGADGADAQLPQRRIDDWEAANRSIVEYLEPAAVDQLRSWAKQALPGATTASINTALWLSALRAEGVAVDERVMILMNCRRYLHSKYAAAQGNFAVGIPLAIPEGATAPAIATMVRAVIDSGWPILVLILADVKSLLRRTRPAAAAQSVVVPDRLRLAVSDLGKLPIFDDIEFLPGRPPQLSAYLEPDGADAISLLIAELGGGRTFTASFCSEMVDPAVIARALKRISADPVALLSAVVVPAP